MSEKTRGYFAEEGDTITDLDKEADDLRLAIVSLLVSAAQADANFSDAEQKLVATVASTKLGLSESKVAALLKSSTSEDVVSDAIASIQRLGSAQREQILTFIWAIIGVDHLTKREEGIFAVKLRTQLNLTMEQALRARQISESKAILDFKEFLEASPDVIAGTNSWLESRSEKKK